jgi:hypothetical protein
MYLEKKAVIKRSEVEGKKYTVFIMTRGYGEKWKRIGIIHFGQKGASDFTKHRDRARRMNYLKRHGAMYPESKKNDVNYAPKWSSTETWTSAGWDTPGFYSRWMLWNDITLTDSARDIYKRFDIDVVLR